MSELQSTKALQDVAHKWRKLAERRRAHLIELYYSGRWKHCYTEEGFLRQMRDAIQAAERWALIAPPIPELASDEDPTHRDAA
jgi:uncharacterized repeat protein (TIGR03809 family)